MTEYQHPITPPPELVEQWRTVPEYASYTEKLTMVSMTTRRLWEIAIRAARWGADQELEACCAWVEREIGHGREWGAELRRLRRPKPLSLAEQALEAVDALEGFKGVDTIRAALERLQEMEGNG